MKRNTRINDWLLALAWAAFILVATSWIDDDQAAPVTVPAVRTTYRA